MVAASPPKNAASLLRESKTELNPFRPPKRLAWSSADVRHGAQLANTSVICGVLAPLLVFADILYAIIVMDAGCRPSTSLDDFTAHVFFVLWIALPSIGILASVRFFFLYATERTIQRGFIRASIGGTLCVLFTVSLTYIYLFQ